MPRRVDGRDSTRLSARYPLELGHKGIGWRAPMAVHVNALLQLLGQAEYDLVEGGSELSECLEIRPRNYRCIGVACWDFALAEITH